MSNVFGGSSPNEALGTRPEEYSRFPPWERVPISLLHLDLQTITHGWDLLQTQPLGGQRTASPVRAYNPGPRLGLSSALPELFATREPAHQAATGSTLRPDRTPLGARSGIIPDLS